MTPELVDGDVDQQAYREYQREDEQEKRQPWGGRYSTEAIGKALTHWPELLEARERTPGVCVEVIDIQAALEAVLSDQEAMRYAEHSLMSGDECDPPKVVVASVRTHQEREVYPPASEFRLEVAVLNAQAMAIQSWEERKPVLAQAAMAAGYNRAVRIFGDIRRLVNPQRERKPLPTTARYAARCSRCPDPIIIGQQIYVHKGQIWHLDDEAGLRVAQLSR